MSEKSEAKRDGSVLQKNSGRGRIQKGDAVRGSFLCDIKEYAKSYSLSTASWAKVCSDAWKSNRRIPYLKVVLGEGNKKVRLLVFEEQMGNEMMDLWEEKYGQ